MIGIREGAADGWRGSWQRLQGRPLGEWPVKVQAGVAVLLALGVSVAAGVVVLRLGQEDLTLQRERQLKLQQDYRLRVDAVARLPALRGQAREMAEQQAVHPALAPTAAREAALLSALHQAAARQGLQVGRLQPGKEKLQDGHARQGLQMRVEGGYEGVQGMLGALQRLPWSVVAERWSLAPERSKAGRSRGTLVLQGKFSVYRFTLPGERPVRKTRKSGGKTP